MVPKRNMRQAVWPLHTMIVAGCVVLALGLVLGLNSRVEAAGRVRKADRPAPVGTPVAGQARSLPEPSLLSLDPALAVLLHPQPREPELTRVEPQRLLDPRMQELWRAGLGQEDAETRRIAARALGAAAGAEADWLASFFPKLAELAANDPSPIVRLAAAEALITLDARPQAPAVLALNDTDAPAMILLTDPALARWNVTQAKERWQARAADATRPASVRCSAIASLQTIGSTGDADLFSTLALRQDHAAVRLAAARALVAMGQPVVFLEPLPTGNITDALVSVTLSSLLPVPRQRPLLISLAQHEDVGVARAAMSQLLRIDPGAVLALPQRLPADPGVQAIRVQALASDPTPPSVLAAVESLNQPEPIVTAAARTSLTQLATHADLLPALHKALRELAVSEQPATVKAQAWIMLAITGDASSLPALAALLDAPELVLRQAAILGLTTLGGATAGDALLARATAVESRLREPGATGLLQVTPGPFPPPPTMEDELGWLLQAMARLNHTPASPLMLRVLGSRPVFGPGLRAVAAWSLGHLSGDAQAEAVRRVLVDRLKDDGLDPEDEHVRAYAAVALGLRQWADRQEDLAKLTTQDSTLPELSAAARWSLTHRGQARLIPPSVRIDRRGEIEPMQ